MGGTYGPSEGPASRKRRGEGTQARHKTFIAPRPISHPGSTGEPQRGRKAPVATIFLRGGKRERTLSPKEGWRIPQAKGKRIYKCKRRRRRRRRRQLSAVLRCCFYAVGPLHPLRPPFEPTDLRCGPPFSIPFFRG